MYYLCSDQRHSTPWRYRAADLRLCFFQNAKSMFFDDTTLLMHELIKHVFSRLHVPVNGDIVKSAGFAYEIKSFSAKHLIILLCNSTLTLELKLLRESQQASPYVVALSNSHFYSSVCIHVNVYIWS